MNWVNIDDGLPEAGKRVLIKTTTCGMMVASMGGATIDGDLGFVFEEGWRWEVIDDIIFTPEQVTHWMELPSNPTVSRVENSSLL